jgi:hypothetical protein
MQERQEEAARAAAEANTPARRIEFPDGRVAKLYGDFKGNGKR